MSARHKHSYWATNHTWFIKPYKVLPNRVVGNCSLLPCARWSFRDATLPCKTQKREGTIKRPARHACFDTYQTRTDIGSSPLTGLLEVAQVEGILTIGNHLQGIILCISSFMECKNNIFSLFYDGRGTKKCICKP